MSLTFGSNEAFLEWHRQRCAIILEDYGGFDDVREAVDLYLARIAAGEIALTDGIRAEIWEAYDKAHDIMESHGFLARVDY